MPRNGRGGARTGTPGKAYANRSDLNTPKPLPVTAATGQQYGQATAQKNAQRIVPMGNAPLGIGNQQAPQGAQSAGPPPGGLPDLLGPTQNPNEHFMTGVNAGPGAGSEALAPMQAPSPTVNALTLLNSLGNNVSPQVAHIRDYLAAQAQNDTPFG